MIAKLTPDFNAFRGADQIIILLCRSSIFHILITVISTLQVPYKLKPARTLHKSLLEICLYNIHTLINETYYPKDYLIW